MTILPNIKNFDTYFHFDKLNINKNGPYALFNVVQLGDISCAPDYIGPVHLQMCYEISYIISGSGIFVCDNIEYPVKKGMLCINRIGEEHYTISSAYDPMRFFYIGFTINKNADKDAVIDIIKTFETAKTPIIMNNFGNIHSLFLNLFQETKTSFNFNNIVFNACLNQLVCLTCRNFLNSYSQNTAINKRNQKQTEILYAAVHYIEDNILNIQKLTDISKHLGYTHPYVSGIFSDNMGMTMKEYFDQTKIQIAIDMICNGNGITQTANELNFDSLQSFSNKFKRHTGLSPTEYIKLEKEKKIQKK